MLQLLGLVLLKWTASQGYSNIPVRDSKYRITVLAKTALVQHHSHSPKQVSLDLIQPLCGVETTSEGQLQASSTVSMVSSGLWVLIVQVKM